MNKVAIYTRVSTEEQVKDGFSLQAQERALKDYCGNNDYEIFDIYTDEGVSGRSIKKRKELSRLLSDAENKKFDLVLIYKLDRLSRTVKDAYTIIDILVKNDIGVLSISEKHINFSTAQQRAMFGMSMVFAQLEVEQISERVVFGMREAARSKKAIFDLPYGYKNNNGSVEIVEEQAEVVKEIFSLYKDGLGINAIAKLLNSRGIDAPKSKSWHANTINRCLQNKAYHGYREIRFQKLKEVDIQEDVYPVIIPKEEFEEIQKIREFKASIHPKAAHTSKNSPIFTGFIKCGRCGKAISTVGFSRDGRRRYRCGGSAQGVCNLPSFYEEHLESSFIEALIGIQDVSNKHSDRFSQQLKKSRKINDLKRNLQLIEKKKKKNYEAWENDWIDVEFFKSKVAELKEEEATITAELDKLEASNKTPKIFDLECDDITAMWDSWDSVEKKQFLITYIDEIFVDASKHDSLNNLKKIQQINNVRIIDIVLS